MAKPKLSARNTKVENVYDTAMVVEVRQDPGYFEMRRDVILPGEHIYMCYEDFNIEYNRHRPVYVFVYLEGAREMSKTNILPADIRANQKLELNYLNGAITITRTKGYFISRLGLIIKFKHIAEQIKSRGK